MQKSTTYWHTFVVAFSLSALTAPAVINAQDRMTTSERPRGIGQPNVSEMERDLAGGEFLTQADRDLVERVWVRLDNDPNLTNTVQDLDIWADAGEVTLWGTVGSQEEKRAISAKVRAIKGVEEVNNRLRVSDDDIASTSLTSSSRRSSGDLYAEGTSSEERRSRWWPPDRQVGAGASGADDEHLPGSGAMAETDRTGTTGPSGTRTFSPSGGAIDAVARAAKPAGDYAFTTLDRDLAARIRQALNGDPSLPVNDENVHLKVVSGTVTLEGQVPSVQAKSDIEDKIAQMSGVRGINNRLQVSRSSFARQEE